MTTVVMATVVMTSVVMTSVVMTGAGWGCMRSEAGTRKLSAHCHGPEIR
jgi:hypothetical protein